MPKINGAFTKATANAMMDDFANHIKEFEREWGVKIEMRGGKFDASTLQPRMTIRLAGETKIEDQYAAQAKCWEVNWQWMGFQKDWLHKTVKDFSGQEFKIVGLNSRRPRRPVAIVNLKTGKMHVANKEWLIAAMNMPVNTGK